MRYKSENIDEYLQQLPEERREVINKLRKIIKENLPEGFEEKIQYDMISYVVPRETYLAGYHVDPSNELGFMAIGSQKNHVAIYSNAVYMFEDVNEWYLNEYSKHLTTKPDMGKSCLRFKNMNKMPYELIAELCQKITVDEFVKKYEETLKK